jgi:sigma-B regulation protein RsbU (phosphoserine phosphatase)
MVSGRFVTFCFAWIDPAGGLVTYVNAGHNPPLLVRANGTVARLCEGGVVLGVFPDTTFNQAEIAFNPGDRLLLYTDGISEARNASGEEFGEERLAQAGLSARTLAPTAMNEHLARELQAFTGGALDDDATIIVVGRR